MAAVGIVAEYNPFHNGHLYHLRETKRRFPDKAVVCVMSGNFVQRGEPALLPKSIRAAMAAESGVDLVLELPVAFANAPAEIFAARAASLLAATGVVSALSFGSECGDLAKLKRAAAETEFDHVAFAENMGLGCSYAKARADAYPFEIRKIFSSPNNLLAIEYIRAAEKVMPHAELFTVSRRGAAHDAHTGSAEILSATRIRELVRAGEDTAAFLPEAAAKMLDAALAEGRCPVSADALSLPILAELRRISPEDGANLPEVSEGLEHRLISCAAISENRETLLLRLKTRRYTEARLRRILISAYLGLTKADQAIEPQYLRVLAATKRGTELLKLMRKRANLPVITKPAAVKLLTGDAVRQYTAEARADALYALAYPREALRSENGFFCRSPYIVTADQQ